MAERRRKTDVILAGLRAEQEAELKRVAKLASRWEAAASAVTQAESALSDAKAQYRSAIAHWVAATSAASVARLTGLPARTVSELVSAHRREQQHDTPTGVD